MATENLDNSGNEAILLINQNEETELTAGTGAGTYTAGRFKIVTYGS